MNEVWHARDGTVARGARAWSSPDPRSPQRRIYSLACLVAIAICAFTAAGNDRFTAVGQWIRRASQQDLARLRAVGPDGHRASHELVEAPGSSTIQRHVRDGRRFRPVKMALEPRSPERSLRELGWVIEVRPLAGPFLPGLGGRAG